MGIELSDVPKLARKDASEREMKLSINLLGVGGVGTNILRIAARGVGPRRFFFRVWDHDTIELHNLNRTSLFRLGHIGFKKVRAVRAVLRHSFDAPDLIRDDFDRQVDAGTPLPRALTIDARDTLDPTKMVPQAWIKLAYDGGSSISFTWKPALMVGKILDLAGGANAYAVVPSFYVPAAMLAALTFNYFRFVNFAEITDRAAGTFSMDMDTLTDELLYEWTAPGEPGEEEELCQQ